MKRIISLALIMLTTLSVRANALQQNDTIFVVEDMNANFMHNRAFYDKENDMCSIGVCSSAEIKNKIIDGKIYCYTKMDGVCIYHILDFKGAKQTPLYVYCDIKGIKNENEILYLDKIILCLDNGITIVITDCDFSGEENYKKVKPLKIKKYED